MLMPFRVAPVYVFARPVRVAVAVLVDNGEKRFHLAFLHLTQPCDGAFIAVLTQLELRPCVAKVDEMPDGDVFYKDEEQRVSLRPFR